MTVDPRTNAGGSSGIVPAGALDAWRRLTGAALIAGAIATIALNAIFPRADDPGDVVAVLTTMADHEVRQKVSFIGGTIGLWVLVGGIAGLSRMLGAGPASKWARMGFYAVLAGVTLFTASTGLGLAATHAAVDWAAAGYDTSSIEFAVASAASAVDDAVWAMSIVALWLGLGVLGTAMIRDPRFPAWIAVPMAVIGFANASLAGVPIAYAGASLPTVIMFGALALLTSAWALVTGIWLLRRGPRDAQTTVPPASSTKW